MRLLTRHVNIVNWMISNSLKSQSWSKELIVIKSQEARLQTWAAKSLETWSVSSLSGTTKQPLVVASLCWDYKWELWYPLWTRYYDTRYITIVHELLRISLSTLVWLWQSLALVFLMSPSYWLNRQRFSNFSRYGLHKTWKKTNPNQRICQNNCKGVG